MEPRQAIDPESILSRQWHPQESMQLQQIQSGKQLKIVIKAHQSPLIRDGQRRQKGIRAKAWRYLRLAHQAMEHIPSIVGCLRVADPGLLHKRLQQG